jgi:hypothetical protein
MEHPREICLEVEESVVRVQVRKATRERSVHSGRELTELHGVVTTTDEQRHAWLREVLPRLTECAVRARDAGGDSAGRWVVSWNSYTVNAGVHSYTLLLREAEELSLEVLELAGTELYPYEYRERAVDHGLTIWMKLVGHEEDVLRLRQLVRRSPAFPVVRRGISDEPRSMRLGVGEWSRFEDQVKYRLVLVDASLPSGSHEALVRVEEENTRGALAFYANLVERLSERLIQKGLLTDAELTEMREAAAGVPVVSRHDFWRVPDVDAL